MILIGLEEKKKFHVRAWLIFRYFSLNSTELDNEEYRAFYEASLQYFTKKFWFVEDLKTLFKLESEEHIEINKEVIDQTIFTYKQNPMLLVYRNNTPKNGIFTLK